MKELRFKTLEELDNTPSDFRKDSRNSFSRWFGSKTYLKQLPGMFINDAILEGIIIETIGEDRYSDNYPFIARLDNSGIHNYYLHKDCLIFDDYKLSNMKLNHKDNIVIKIKNLLKDIEYE